MKSIFHSSQVYPPLSKELFHAAFVSCWFELLEQYQENLVRSLEIAFRSEAIPPDILQMLLNLAEFMEHDVEALPIDIRILADLAQKCHAYAKALHYKELQFQTSPAECIESLISINKKLGQPEAAVGILKYAQKKLGSVIVVKESWLAKLGDWKEALELYSKRLEDDSKDVVALVGCMKCLDALGHWDEIVKLCQSSWDYLKDEGTDGVSLQHFNQKKVRSLQILFFHNLIHRVLTKNKLYVMYYAMQFAGHQLSRPCYLEAWTMG